MGKTTKVIFWQRITIIFMGLFLWLCAGRIWDLQHTDHKDREAARVFEGGYLQRGETLRENERIIRDLDERLSKYEARFGEIEPNRRGEGVYIRQNGPLPSR